MNSVYQTGNIELIFDDLETKTEAGVYISETDAQKFSEMLSRLLPILEDKLDQSMINYCDYVQFVDLSKIMIPGNSKIQNYIAVCNCTK